MAPQAQVRRFTQGRRDAPSTAIGTVASVLGDLAADNDNDARLRRTLRVFLGCGSSYRLAA
jgi:DNA-binding PucR family transcriptional regulator